MFVCMHVCVFYCTCYILSTSKVRTFLGREDILSGPYNIKELFHDRGLVGTVRVRDRKIYSIKPMLAYVLTKLKVPEFVIVSVSVCVHTQRAEGT